MVIEKEKLLINAVYRATEGEGIYVGRPQVFVRFQGCQIGCLNCDSMDTWSFQEGSSLSMDVLLQRVEDEASGKIQWVSLTGGDPLHPFHVPGVRALLAQLKSRGYRVNIEASGVRLVRDIFHSVDFISFDYKPPSTGVLFPLGPLRELCRDFGGKFQVKSVVQDARDFYSNLETYKKLQGQGLTGGFEWCLTPCYNPHEEFHPQRFVEIMELNYGSGSPFRVIGQQHKWVYGPGEKMV